MMLRDYDRQFDPLTEHDWRLRWQQLQNPSPGIRWVTCTENMAAGEFSAELEQHPEIVVMALARRPSANEQLSDMLRVALDSGVPVAVWRRDTCLEHDAAQTNRVVLDSVSGWLSTRFFPRPPSTTYPKQYANSGTKLPCRTPLWLTAIARGLCCSGTIRRERRNHLLLCMSHPTSHWRTHHDQQGVQW